MKKKVISVIFISFFLLSLGLIDYLYIAEIMDGYEQSKEVAAYDNAVKAMSNKKIAYGLKEARNYNMALAKGSVNQKITDSFYQSGDSDGYYNSLLSVTDKNIMGILEIPKIHLKLPVYHGANRNSVYDGVGHIEGSSMPVGGAETHTLMSAHSGLQGKRLFTDLDLLGADDKFFIRVYDKTFAYKVYKTEVLKPDEVDSLLIRKNEDLATLITCTPYGVNTHRLYVHGIRVPYEAGDENKGDGGIPVFIKHYWWVFFTIVALIWMIYLLRKLNKKIT